MARTIAYVPRVIALTRQVPAAFANALCAVPPDPPIDLALAREQHAAYRAALASLGFEVIALPVADALPDSCFVEDTAVVAGGLALITRPGAPSRQAETAAIAAALGERLELAYMTEPATLDGGDCMRVGNTIYAARSARTNAAGIARLIDVFAPRGIHIVPIALPEGVLHLKCVCAPLAEDRITLDEATLSRNEFDGVHVVAIPPGESYAANVLASGDRVLVAAGFPRTLDVLAAAGFTPMPLATTEFRKADAALTCLSILS